MNFTKSKKAYIFPVARAENILIQEVGDELVVYDQETNESHCLNPIVTNVWHFCNGQNTFEDIVRLLERELNGSGSQVSVNTEKLVQLSLEELKNHKLIVFKEYTIKPPEGSFVSRRKVVKSAALVGGFAIGSASPLIKSIIAPEPSMAASGNVKPPKPPTNPRLEKRKARLEERKAKLEERLEKRGNRNKDKIKELIEKIQEQIKSLG